MNEDENIARRHRFGGNVPPCHQAPSRLLIVACVLLVALVIIFGRGGA